MATPIINIFQQFLLTEAEQISGQQYTAAQLMVIQNLRAENAVKKLALVYDPKNPQEFLQLEAELSGWLACLNYLIDCHTEVTEAQIQSNTIEDTESDGDPSTIFN